MLLSTLNVVPTKQLAKVIVLGVTASYCQTQHMTADMLPWIQHTFPVGNCVQATWGTQPTQAFLEMSMAPFGGEQEHLSEGST